MTNKKKVLIVIPALCTGGGEKFVIDLAYGLDKCKFRVKVLVLYPYAGSIFDRFAKKNGMDVEYLDKHLGLDFTLFSKVRRIVRAFDPDIIHTNLDTMLYLLPSYRRKQIKLHTIHSMADKESQGLQRIVRIVAFWISGVVPVAISRIVAESIQHVYRLRSDKVPVVCNGIKCRRYERPREAASAVRLISVGRFQEVKNFSFLIDCFHVVRQHIKNVHLTLLGDGVLRQELEAQIRQLGLEDDITLAGTVADVENYLAAADIYVASSLFEGLPLSMLEAMAAGLPVISTDVGGVSEIVHHGENGSLVELGNQEAYIAALEQLTQDESLRKRYGEESHRIAQEYDISRMIAGYEALYSTQST